MSINWAQGGLNHSIKVFVNREVRKHFRDNSAIRRSRYPTGIRILRFLIGSTNFPRILWIYLLIAVSAVLIEAALSIFCPSLAQRWPNSEILAISNSTFRSVAGHLITVQAGILGVIAIAIGLITIIMRNENSGTDIRTYYHESIAFGIVASSLALLAVLVVQLYWPFEYALAQAIKAPLSQSFKLFFVGAHTLWLLVNLAGMALFVETSFFFVQQEAREKMRERFTANVLFPIDMKERIRSALYDNALHELKSGDSSDLSSGPSISAMPLSDFLSFDKTEVSRNFKYPVILSDIRVRWLRWTFYRWASRCTEDESDQHLNAALYFGPPFDSPVEGKVDICRRKSGKPLSWLERFIIRLCFRFERADP